jgi:hypothetical protein
VPKGPKSGLVQGLPLGRKLSQFFLFFLFGPAKKTKVFFREITAREKHPKQKTHFNNSITWHKAVNKTLKGYALIFFHLRDLRDEAI